MKPKKQDKGMGYYQMEKAYIAQRSILRVLSDGIWHRNMELKEKTKLSSRTLAKHLERLEKTRLIQRKEDVESGRYPVPVFYKAAPETVEYIKTSMFVEETRKLIEPALMEANDPLAVLEGIHSGSQLGFIKIINELKQNRNMSMRELQYLEQLFLYMPYNFFMASLIEASRKIIDELDFDKLVVSQAKRQKEIAELLIKHFSKEVDVDNKFNGSA